MACTECRRRQVKVSFVPFINSLTLADREPSLPLPPLQCTPSESAGQACERCAKRKIKCEFMSIQEQKLLSTPDNDQSSDSITLYLPQYGGPVTGVPCQMPSGPILGDPADVRQGMLSPPADHPLLRPTGMPIPATTWPPHQHPQQMSHPSAQTYHRSGTPSWASQHHPQSTPTPSPRYPTPMSMSPIPQSPTPAQAWYPAGNG